ncbi:MAG: DUF4190 domain-containing protein [Planctomycetes bacterium]|nr:DUF4190 domain-containing protein [Planctomycetota bacterium]
MSDALRPHRGVLILVFGIIGIVLCFPLGIAAWVMGKGDLGAIDRGEMDPTGRGMTQAGMIIGIIATALAAIAIVIWALVLAGALFATAAGH